MEGLPGERIDPCTGLSARFGRSSLSLESELELKLESGSPIRKVLIYRLGSLGDTVVALPCYHLIARLFPDAERRLLTNFPVNAKAPASAAVLGDSGLVHGYMRYTVGTRRIGELLRLVWEIRRFKPDLLIYLMDLRPGTNIRRDDTFFRIAGVKKIVGLPLGGDLKRRFDPETGLYESEALRLGRLIGELGDVNAGDPENWSLRLTDAERQAALRGLGSLAGRQLIVCGPATKMQAKDWERDKWRALLARLQASYPEHGLALVGSQGGCGVQRVCGAGVDGAEGESVRGYFAARDGCGDGACGRVPWARLRADAPGGERWSSVRDCFFGTWAAGSVVPERPAASNCVSPAGVFQLRSRDLCCDGEEMHAVDHRGRDGAGCGPRSSAACRSLEVRPKEA